MSTIPDSSAHTQDEALDEQDKNCIHNSNDATNGPDRESTVSLQLDAAISQGKTKVDNQKDRDMQARATINPIVKQKVRTMYEKNSFRPIAEQLVQEYHDLVAYEDERNEKYQKLKEDYDALVVRNQELEHFRTMATNEMHELRKQGWVHKTDDAEIEALWGSICYQCRNWASNYCGSDKVGVNLRPVYGKAVDKISYLVSPALMMTYLDSPVLRPVLVQAHIMRELQLKVFSSENDEGLVWAGEFHHNVRALHRALEPGKF